MCILGDDAGGFGSSAPPAHMGTWREAFGERGGSYGA